jgi:hypothetical protein
LSIFGNLLIWATGGFGKLLGDGTGGFVWNWQKQFQTNVWRYCPTKIKVIKSGVNRRQMLQFWGAGYLFYFKGTSSWIFLKNVFSPLEPKLLVMWEGIGERHQHVCVVLHSV